MKQKLTEILYNQGLNKNFYINILICGIFSFILNLAATSYIKNHGASTQEIIESIYLRILQTIIEEELQPAFIPEYESIPQDKKTDFLKNYFNNRIFISKSFINDKRSLVYLSNFTIQALFEKITGKEVFYAVAFNNQKILGNKNHLSLQENLKQLENNLTLSVKLNNEYLLRESYIKQLKNHIIIANIICLLVFLISSILIIKKEKNYLKERKKFEVFQAALSSANIANQEILLFNKINKSYIEECYNYSKEILSEIKSPFHAEEFNEDEDYLPVSLFSLGKVKKEINVIDLLSLRSLLIEYFKGYKAYTGVLLELEIELVTPKAFIPLNKNLFNQIIISLFSNFLHFNKDTKNPRYVKLLFKDNEVVCLSNGFLLEKNLAVKYSRKILHETGNIFLLNLGQIFNVFDKFSLPYLVSTDKENTKVEFSFKEENKKISNNLLIKEIKDSKIINIQRFKQNKKL
jgi:hypothetical protein